jgi:hypothetical protein
LVGLMGGLQRARYKKDYQIVCLILAWWDVYKADLKVYQSAFSHFIPFLFDSNNFQAFNNTHSITTFGSQWTLDWGAKTHMDVGSQLVGTTTKIRPRIIRNWIRGGYG